MPNTGNSLELKVVLGVNSSLSKVALNQQIKDLEKQLSEVKIDIKIDPNAIAGLTALSKIDFSKLTTEAKEAAKETSKFAKVSADEINTAMKKFENVVGVGFGKSIRGSAADIDFIKKKLAGTNAVIDVKFDTVNGMKDLKALQTTVEKDGITQKVTFEKVAVTGDKNNESEYLWMPKMFQEVDRQLSSATKNTDELIAKITKLRTEGKITDEQFEKLSGSISGISGKSGLDRANQMMDTMVASTKKVNDNLNERERIEKQLITNQQKIQTQILAAEKAMKSNPTLGGTKEANDLVASYQKLNPASKNFKDNLFEVNTQFTRMKTAASEASRSSMGLMESFKIAMTKFPIWMAASTLFYGAVRGATDLTRKVVELDSAMVNLRRVMDLPEYKFNEMLEQSMVNVDNLSGKLTDYLNLVGEFGRMGFNDVETLDMSDTAQMLSNISDLTADESVSSLVAAMTAFNITAEESVNIADKLNEVDNQYSITTKDLAQSMNKSASTAKVFGVSLEELLGYTTAIGSATRESGNVVGNSLKTIMSRIMTLPRAATALDAIGISIKDMEGQVRPVGDVIDEVGKKWSSLSAEEQQNTAIKVAGTNQLSRFNALMLNYGVAVDATTTAMDAQGSASREQEKYNQSLEARINRLNTAWYGLADSVGQSILYDGIVVVTKALGGATKAGDSAVASIGALPILFGITGAAVALLSTRFSVWTGTMIANRATALLTTATNGTLSASMLTLAATSTVAQRALMMTGVGAALVAVGIGISLFTSAMSKNIQEQEEFDAYLEKNVDALGSNKKATEELIGQYYNLSQAKKEGSWSSEKEKEYLEVQQRLGENFPALIKNVDSTGQSHIKNKESIEAEIKATEDLMDAQNKSTIENSNKEFEKLNEDLNGSWYESFSNYASGSLESRIKQQKNILEAMRESGSNDGAMAEQELKLKKLERQYQQTSEEIKGYIFDVANAMSDVDISSGLSNTLQEFVGGLDLSELDDSELESFSKEIGTIQEELQRAIDSGDEKSFDSIIGKLNELAAETNGFDSEYGGLSATLQDGNITLENSAEIISVLGDESEDTANAVDGMAQAVEDNIAKLKELTTVEEQLAGVSQNQIEAVDGLIFLYRNLSSQTSLTSEQTESLSNAQRDLALLYPHLVKNGEVRIDMIEAERKAQEYLLKMVEASRNGQLTAEEEKTLGQLLATNARITNINTEIAAVAKLANAYSGVYEATKQAAENGDEGAAKALMRMSVPIAKFNSLQAELATATASTSKLNREASYAVDRVENSTENASSATKEKTAAEEKANKEAKKSAYYADKYAKSLEKVNEEIRKQQTLQSKFPVYAKQHTDALKKEIVLQEKKKKLLQSQTAELDKQIKSGKIAPKGIVTTTSSSSASTSSASSSGGSKYSGKYASAVNKASVTYNIDPKLIAAIIRAESNFNPNARSGAGAQGLMQLMPATARELGVKNSYDPEQNIMGGVKYLAQQLKAFGGDIELALAAYNAGAGNVRKYGGIPPFKETQNYIKKIMAEFGRGVATVSASNTKKLSGWTGTRSGHFGDSRAGGTRRHGGIDIAQPKGTRIDANVGGKVIASGSARSQGYDSSYGNLVVVQDSKGAKHFYAHMEKTIAKLGSTIKAGQQLGTVGSTGASTGPHLHYGVQKNGTFVNPESYVKAAQKGVSSGSSDSQTKAEAEQSIDQARSDLSDLAGDVAEVEAIIQELRMNLIQAEVAGYERKIEKLGTGIARLEWVGAERARKAGGDENSKAFRSAQWEILEIKNKQIKLMQEESYYLDRQIRNNKNLTAEQREQLKVQREQLKEALIAEYTDRRALEHSIRDSGVNQHIEEAEKRNKVNAEYIEQLKYQANFLDDEEKNSAALIKNMKEQLKVSSKMKETALENIRQLETEKKVVKEFPDLVKKIQEEIDRWKQEYKDLTTVTYETQAAIEDIYNTIADTIIEQMKAVYEKQKEMALKAIDEEREAYQKLIDDKIKLLDEVAEKEDFEKDRTERQGDIQEIQGKINLLGLDDSQFAKAEKAKLQKELDELQKGYDEFITDKERADRKEALEEELADKNKELDAEAKATEEHWDEIINDERRWAAIRADILKGNVQTYIDEFANMSKWLNSHMKDIGNSITENLVDQLKEAKKLLDSIKGVDSGANVGSGNTKVYTGSKKEDKSGKKTKKQDKVYIKQDTFMLKKQGNEYIPTEKMLKKGTSWKAYGTIAKDGVYKVGNGFLTSDPKYTKYQYFKSGGYTGNNVPDEGALAVLHNKEIVLKENDTSNLLKTINLMHEIQSRISPLQPPKLDDRNTGSDVSIANLVNIENFNGTKAEKDSLAKDIMTSLYKMGVTKK